LAESGAKLLVDPNKPLINRATLGQYRTGDAIMEPFIQALIGDSTANESLWSM
jgi:hypothetical protein